MDINITAIERNLRLYGGPGLIWLIGMAGALLIEPSAPVANPFEQMIYPIKQGLFLGASAMAVGGAIWGMWRAWLEYRWERGDLIGGCHNCGGPMRHLTGRYGNYSKCLMCGSKREGWH